MNDIDKLQSTLDMYRHAWIRELGGKLIPKTHEIDALVLTTRMLKNFAQADIMRECTTALRDTVTRRDIVSLIEEWEQRTAKLEIF